MVRNIHHNTFLQYLFLACEDVFISSSTVAFVHCVMGKYCFYGKLRTRVSEIISKETFTVFLVKVKVCFKFHSNVFALFKNVSDVLN